MRVPQHSYLYVDPEPCLLHIACEMAMIEPTLDDKDLAIVNDLRAGVSYTQIAETRHVGMSKISRLAQDYGFRHSTGKAKRLHEDTKKALMDDLRNGMKASTAARMYGISSSTARDYRDKVFRERQA